MPEGQELAIFMTLDYQLDHLNLGQKISPLGVKAYWGFPQKSNLKEGSWHYIVNLFNITNPYTLLRIVVQLSE